jgi:hypothetical protein
MFTWICPDCGREVPPSYTECPDCAERKKAPAAAGPSAIVPEGPAAPPRAPYLRIPELTPPPVPPKKGIPTWLMSIVFALAFGGLVAGAYYGVQFFRKEPTAAPALGAATMETPASATTATPAKTNSLLKRLEISGLRLSQTKDQKTEVRFVVINHSGAEVVDLAATINLHARTRKNDDSPIGTFAFKVPLLAPYESKEVTALVDTNLKVYELPDWQNLEQQIQITSPQL